MIQHKDLEILKGLVPTPFYLNYQEEHSLAAAASWTNTGTLVLEPCVYWSFERFVYNSYVLDSGSKAARYYSAFQWSVNFVDNFRILSTK